MRRLVVRIVAALVGLTLLVAGLAYLSRITTETRVYYGAPPFVVQLTVVGAQGEPVPEPRLRLLDTETGEPVAGYLVYNAIPPAGLVGDAQGHATLHFAGFQGEFEEWHLFWLFRQTPYPPQGLEPYVVEVTAPSGTPQRFPLLSLMQNEAGTTPAPRGDQQVKRFDARVTL